MNQKKLVTSGNTFFGTKASYEASISSGRLTYFGIDTLANEIGQVYEHHYDRLDLNGKLLDEVNFFKFLNFNSGVRYLTNIIKKTKFRYYTFCRILSCHGRFYFTSKFICKKG
ncbi:DUF6090 family protein [Candidatus Marinimicrobia bacterium]|nr:DUF6090 family protein [Candidatus Neomarinimicrobiota bacterium]